LTVVANNALQSWRHQPGNPPGRANQSKGIEMTTTITRRIVTALTGSALAAGTMAGGVALGAPAQAQAGTGSAATCVTAPVSGRAPTMLNPLTRAAQVAAYDAPSQPVAVATSCIGH
jgi:hypothetical protein